MFISSTLDINAWGLDGVHIIGGGDAVFGDVVHLLRADLHLEHHAVGAHDRGVE